MDKLHHTIGLPPNAPPTNLGDDASYPFPPPVPVGRMPLVENDGDGRRKRVGDIVERPVEQDLRPGRVPRRRKRLVGHDLSNTTCRTRPVEHGLSTNDVVRHNILVVLLLPPAPPTPYVRTLPPTGVVLLLPTAPPTPYLRPFSFFPAPPTPYVTLPPTYCFLLLLQLHTNITLFLPTSSARCRRAAPPRQTRRGPPRGRRGSASHSSGAPHGRSRRFPGCRRPSGYPKK